MRFYAFWLFILSSIPFTLRDPSFGVLVYSCMNIVRPELLFWGGHAKSQNAMQIVVVAVLLGLFFNSGKIDFKKLYNRELILMLCVSIGVIVSLFFSEYELPRQNYYAQELFKITILCGLIILLVNSPEKIFKYEKYLLYSIIFLAIWGIDQHFKGNVRLEKLGGFDSNGIAALFALFLPIAFSKVIEGTDTKDKIIGFFATASIALTIIFTQSRGGLLGLIVGIAFCFFYSKKKKLILSTIFIVLIITTPFVSDQYSERMETMTNRESLGGSATSRLHLWKAGLMIFADNPILGTGLLSFPLEKFNYIDRFEHLDPEYLEWLFRVQSPKVTHNTYIKYLADCGLVASLPFLLLLFFTLSANRKIRTKIPPALDENKKLIALLTGIECGIVGHCVSIMFIDANFMIFLYVQIAVCSAIRGVLNTDESLNKSSALVI